MIKWIFNLFRRKKLTQKDYLNFYENKNEETEDFLIGGTIFKIPK